MINEVTLIGRLGRDPELRYTQTGIPVATFSMATTEKWTDRDGEKQEKTEWHKIVAWRKTAEICSEYYGKGDLVYIKGKLQTRQWEDKDGNKRQVTEIVISHSWKISGDGSQQDSRGSEAPSVVDLDSEEDVPF